MTEIETRAADVLYVLNGLEPPALGVLEFCVVTTGAKERWSNADQKFLPCDPLSPEAFWPFERAEILVVDSRTGREPWGEGRKPTKWFVACEYFSTLAEAVACRERVLGVPGGQ
jgi:hypothetical protein